MHANLILLFKPALYSRILVIKLFKSTIKLFYAKIHYRPVLFYKLRNSHSTPTFKTEALRLVSNVKLVKFYCEMNGKYSITLLFFEST